jgi:arginine metabolism regulation protein II
MIKGDANKRRAWLVQTEKFIRIKGFNQPTLSSKRRALHHCYAYMRIMAETTCIAATLNINMNASMGTTGSTDTGDFRIYTKQAFSEATMLMDKDPEMAQRDLHLAIPGRWTATLFPSVYGVDEVFLLLLSQVIRLANERDMSIMTTDTSKVNMSLKEFWTLAKELESAIDHLLLPTTTSPVLGHNDRLLTESTRTAQAMYTALSIFFHRRIYEIDPIMLQGKVNDIRVCLTRAQQEEEGQSDCRSAGLIWPAFIAACEAVTPELQAFFVSWFECCVRKTALVQASGAKKIVETIWKKRSEPNQHGETCSWPDFLRDGAIKFTCV